MASGDETRFTHSVFVVREDQDGRYPELIDQPFKLDAMYKPSTSVLFRLSVPITISTKIIVYLQITPDRILSLHNTSCDMSDTSDRSPHCLDLVRGRMGGTRFVTRLQFQLHSGLHGQLIVPADFDPPGAPDSPAQRLFSSVTSLAAASLFSVYMPHNVLPMTKFQNFARAVRQFPTLTAAQRHAYERMVDLRRLYHGKGGIVFTVEDRDTAQDRDVTPPPDESDVSTVAVDTPSRYRGSPPRYEECPSEGHQSRGRSNATTVSADSPTRDCAPPAYEDEQHCSISITNKRVLQCGSEDVDLHPSPKRRHQWATLSTRDAQLPEKISRPHPHPHPHAASGDYFESRLQFQLEQQQRQIERLQEDIKALQRRNKELEERHNELEENQYKLGNRQVETEEAIESILVHTGELDEECERLGKQMPNAGDEVEDWVKDNMGDTVKEYMADWLKENMSETIQQYIEQQVTAQIAGVKTKMRLALED